MKEDLLHYAWRYGKYPAIGLRTTTAETLHVENSGLHNKVSGPDYFNGLVVINDQRWAGNIEIHIKSSDWYAHNHQQDDAYNNVILHVVWEDDVSVYRQDGTLIPTLELKNYISKSLLESYQHLFDKKRFKFINCENQISSIDGFKLNNWVDRLFIERLEEKSKLIIELLKISNNDWEQVLFLMLLKNFGSKINGDAFLELGKTIGFKIVRKLYQKPIALESLLMGQAGLLKNELPGEPYFNQLKNEYEYLKHKFQLNNSLTKSPDFFKLRPANFPTIRLSQFASMYAANNQLFQSVINSDLETLPSLFDLETSSYWDTHYNFGKISKKSKKKISAQFIELLLINTIVPLKFHYQKSRGVVDQDAILQLMKFTKPEENSIIEGYKNLGLEIKNAKTSQAYLQLHKFYCTKSKCLDCVIGASLMNLKV